MTLSKDGAQRSYFVHRLVAGAFLPEPNGELEVNHKNGIKTDNNVDNLEYVTRSENQLHAVRNGLTHQRDRRKLNNDQVRFVRNTSFTCKRLSEILGVSVSLISHTRTRRLYKDVV